MIAELKPYPAMKDSDVPWLGQVPDHWNTTRFWTVTYLRSEKNRPDLDLLSVFLGRGVIPYAEGGGQVHKPSLDLTGYQVVYPGDLVLNNQQAWRGSVGVSIYHGIISPAYLVFALGEEFDSGFANYLFQSRVMVDQFVSCSKGVGDIQRDIYTTWLRNARVPVPTIGEQALIVRYLDYIDRRVRRYISAKEKLIALLQEQKQAIIHRAITRGLDPDVPLKPLGATPPVLVNERFNTPRFWTVADPRSDKNRPDLDLLSVFLGRGVIPYVEGGGQVHKPSLDLTGYQVVYPGDLVLNNQQAWRGSVGVSSYHGIISPAYLVFALGGELHSGYANYLFQSRVMVDQFLTSSKGVGDIQRDIYTTWLRNARVPVPRIGEQAEIAAYLDQELSVIRLQDDLTRRQIELVREYRTRLIADAVTGKLDVREAAANLPDEPDEREPLDEVDDVMDEGDAMVDDLDAVAEEVEV